MELQTLPSYLAKVNENRAFARNLFTYFYRFIYLFEMTVFYYVVFVDFISMDRRFLIHMMKFYEIKLHNG